MIQTTQRRSSSLTLPAAAVLFTVLAGILWSSPAHAQEASSVDFVSGEVVVKLLVNSNGTTDCVNTINEISEGESATIKDRLVENPRVACIYLLQLPQNSDTQAAATSIAGKAGVAYAELNFVTDAPEGGARMRARGDSTPDTNSSGLEPYNRQYAVEKMKLSGAHSVSSGSGAVVAVLDTGVQQDHPELANTLVRGYDFVGDPLNNASDDGDPSDEPGGIMSGHGTHVAGIVHLAAPEAKIMPLRVLNPDGHGNVFEIAEAAEYAVNNGADVINMSLGSSQESELMSDLIASLSSEEDDDNVLENVPEEGVVVVASAGNEYVSDRRYPAAGEEGEGKGVLSVTSVDAQEQKSDFANFDDRLSAAPGSWIDIAAPGDDIHSLFPTSQYAEWDGTSMAAPFVAGQAALLRSLAPGVKAAGVGDTGCPSVEKLIEDSARSLDAQNPEYFGKLGAGHADADESVRAFQPQVENCLPADTQEPPPPPPANTAPVIWDPRPVPGSATRDRTPVIAAKISDAQTDLAKSNVRLFLDGRERGMFSYDNAENNRLIFASGRLGYGGHRAIIVAEDPEGLFTKKAWSFRVVR